jgi:putative endonuclease
VTCKEQCAQRTIAFVRDPEPYAVYIMSNGSMTLYTGFTGDLRGRVLQHKRGEGPPTSYTVRYHCTRLVYYEWFTDARVAIDYEKRLKGRSRARKIAIVKEMNPTWVDLAGDWYGVDEMDASRPRR